MIIGNNYGHGGDIYRNKISLDFSANVNPYGTPEAVKEAIRKAADNVAVYPDPYCGELRKKLSAHTGASEDEIICGNGAAEIIFQFVEALRPGKTLLPVPSFSEYESALKVYGKEVELYLLKRENGFALTDDILERITEDTDLIMLCNPNNPTGQPIDGGLLFRILSRCRETGTWLFLDECFISLTEEGSCKYLYPQLREGDRVFLLNAFTKLYGMAGVRLGYGISKNKEMLERMCSIVQPWNVSALAQAAGCAALGCEEWADETRRRIFDEKKYLLAELEALGIEHIGGVANFIMLCKVPGLYEKMLEKGILIRSCANYHGLEDGDCRIAVKKHEENVELIEALKEVLGA
ncbi:MAG: aminotransferase class I/II-fold pyridoxal phosphate-dependent enzyme [Firmicutes bacterium]|nr:aminotransferase class I/II-fold pyridoxal phosphate-dependent enzyme [Bacillota bacterium]